MGTLVGATVGSSANEQGGPQGQGREPADGVGRGARVTWEVEALRRLTDLMTRAATQEHLQDLLDLVVEGAADVVGFQVAAISLVDARGDLEVVAVAGDVGAQAELIGRVSPRSAVEAEFAVAQHWGGLRFVPAEDLPADASPGWVSTAWERPSVDDAWHPDDTLMAPFLDPSGELVGMLSVDLPLDGRRPDQLHRGVLELFANQAGSAINAARQRDLLAERVRLAEAVQTVARISQQELESDRVVAAVVDPIAAGLRCSAIWVRAIDVDRDGSPLGVVGHNLDEPPTHRLVDVARAVADVCWSRQRVFVLSDRHLAQSWDADLVAPLRGYLDRNTAGSLFVAPIGAGNELLGYIVGTRPLGSADWTEAERHAALEMGRDLGRAVLNARLFALERRVAEELRAADRARTTLFATVSHELKHPLASTIGHLELLTDDEEDVDPHWSYSVIERNTLRMQRLVDDLLTVSKVSDPDRPLEDTLVDVSDLVRDAVDMFGPTAAAQGVTLVVGRAPRGMTVRGNEHELGRVAENLISNAVKFSPSGGTVRVEVTSSSGAVEFTCADSGLGISEADLASLFTEFFRSTNSVAKEISGTGLGLSIVRRVVNRHGGDISVESELGVGTTFTVTLPHS